MLGHALLEFSLCLRFALLMFSLLTLNKALEDLDLHRDNRLADSERGLGCKRGKRSMLDLCSPRVLFMFETCSIDVFTDDPEQSPGEFRPPPRQQVRSQ